jgi:hypothetical protein
VSWEASESQPTTDARAIANLTYASNINEIGVGYYLTAFRNIDSSAKKEFDYCWHHTEPQERIMQLSRACEMANAMAQYLTTMHPTESIKEIQWVGNRKSAAPADLVLNFESGKLLGISCKSSRKNVALCFKNVGVTHFKQTLGLDVRPIYEQAAKDFCVQYGAPFKNTERKLFLRKSDAQNSPIQGVSLQSLAQSVAQETLASITGLIYDVLCQKDNAWLQDYCLRSWMDYYTDIPWVRVTGMGKKKPYKAVVEDPHALEGIYVAPEYRAIQTGLVRLSRIKEQSIGIHADDVPVMKIRAKYESEALASSLKFLGEPL